MIFFFSVLYLIHNFSRIGKTTGYTDLDFGSLIIYRELFDTFFSTDTAFCDLMHRFFAVVIGQATKHCLSHTTGYTEDHTAAGTKSKRHITGFRFEKREFDTKVVDHTKQLCGCDNDICILFSLGKTIRTNSFRLLRSTWHDGNHNSFLPLCMLRITEILFDDCGKHSLRRTAGGQVRNIIFVLIGYEFDPCRTAGSQ